MHTDEDGTATLIRDELTGYRYLLRPVKALKLAGAEISITPMTAHSVLMGKDTFRGLS
jgi:hypothetical protein